MTTRSGRAATPCEVSEPADPEAPRVRPTPARWGDGGGERTLPGGRGGGEVRGAQCSSSRSQVGYERPGRRKLWEGVDASREFWRDAGGRFLERGATLVAVSPSASCTEPCLLVTPGYGSGPWVEGERERAASRQKRLEAPGAQRWPAGVGRAGRTGRRRAGSARARRLGLARPTGVPARERVPSWEWWAEGRCPGTGRGFRDRPLCGFSCAGATPRPGPRAEPVRSRDERHPEKSCAEKVPEDRRARAPRVREGSLSKGRCGRRCRVSPRAKTPSGDGGGRSLGVSWQLWGSARGTGERRFLWPPFGLPQQMAWPALGSHSVRLSPRSAGTLSFLRALPHFLLGHNFTLLGERARCQSAMGIRQASGHLPHLPPPRFSSWPLFGFVGALLYPPRALRVLVTESWKRPAPGLPTSLTRRQVDRQEELQTLSPVTVGSTHLPLTPPAPL